MAKRAHPQRHTRHQNQPPLLLFGVFKDINDVEVLQVQQLRMHWPAWPVTRPEWRGHQAVYVGTTQGKRLWSLHKWHSSRSNSQSQPETRHFINALLTWHTYCNYVYLVGSC